LAKSVCTRVWGVFAAGPIAIEIWVSIAKCACSRDFCPQYAQRFPNVHVELSEALGPEQKTQLERGEVHFGIRLEQGDPRFDSRVLPPAEALAAGATSIERGQAGLIDIGGLASYPLLLLDPGYSIPRVVDAACRLADVEPNILLESFAPHSLLAVAEVG
jgi:DNA-binding transcriptional LysR family regulator